MDDDMLDGLIEAEPVLKSPSQEALAVMANHDLSCVQATDHSLTARRAMIDPQLANPLSDRADKSRPCLPVSIILCEAVSKIENVFEAITESLLKDDKSISIRLTKRSSTLRSIPANSVGLDSREICFPGSTPQEAWRFSYALHTVVVRLLELMHEALITGTTSTKRDMYYKDPALFGKQSVVDRYVDDIASTFQIPRSSLNVVGAAKGLFAGAFTIIRTGNVVMDGTKDCDGILIPNLKPTDTIQKGALKWILVIEKEAVFHSLASSTFWTVLIEQGVIITGKGYPDMATRAALRRLASTTDESSSRITPVYALVDYDPDGLGILSTYKYGSIALSHENHTLSVPQIQWLGLRSSDLKNHDGTHQTQGLLQLSKRDRRKAAKILEWDHISDGGSEPQWRQELQVMLMLNMKAEIQLLDSFPGGMYDWLYARLVHG